MTRNLTRSKLFVLICQGSDCKKAGAKALATAAKKHLRARDAHKESLVLKLKCTGNCKRAPICGILPQQVWIDRTKPEQLIAQIELVLAPTHPTGEDES